MSGIGLRAPSAAARSASPQEYPRWSPWRMTPTSNSRTSRTGLFPTKSRSEYGLTTQRNQHETHNRRRTPDAHRLDGDAGGDRQVPWPVVCRRASRHGREARPALGAQGQQWQVPHLGARGRGIRGALRGRRARQHPSDPVREVLSWKPDRQTPGFESPAGTLAPKVHVWHIARCDTLDSPKASNYNEIT